MPAYMIQPIIDLLAMCLVESRLPTTDEQRRVIERMRATHPENADRAEEQARMLMRMEGWVLPE